MNAVSPLPRTRDVVIHLTDPTVIAHLDALPDEAARDRYLSEAVEIGTHAIDAAGPIASTADVERRFRAMEQRIAALLDDGHLKRILDPADPASPTGQIRQELDGRQIAAVAELRQLVGDFRALAQGQFGDFRTEAAELIAKLDAATRAAEAREAALAEKERLIREIDKNRGLQSATAGENFEARVYNALSRMASARGDACRRTGTLVEKDGKKGDIVYTLQTPGAPPMGIALELKDRRLDLTGQDPFSLSEVDRAMANRGCRYGIMVACLEKNSGDQGPRFPYVQQFNGNRFVVLVDEKVAMPIALEAVIRTVAALAAQEQNQGGRLRLDEINEGVAHAAQVEAMFAAMKRNLEKSINELDKMDGLLADALSELRRAVSQAVPSAAGPAPKVAAGARTEHDGFRIAPAGSAPSASAA